VGKNSNGKSQINGLNIFKNLLNPQVQPWWKKSLKVVLGFNLAGVITLFRGGPAVACDSLIRGFDACDPLGKMPLCLAAPLPAKTNMFNSFFDTARPERPTVGTISSLWKITVERDKLGPQFQSLADDPRANEWIAADTIPIPATDDREGYYGDWHVSYWYSGLSDYFEMGNQVKNLPASKVILDFGGASGRVARHFANFHKGMETLYVVDLNINHTNYINKHFPKNVVGIKICSLASLPFEDSSIDFIYGISVFTHIGAYELMWLKELSRILRPGAFIYLSILDENTWGMLPNIGLYEGVKQVAQFVTMFDKHKEMPDGRWVFNYAEGTHDNNCFVFHSSSYINEMWSKMFDVVRIIPSGHGYQAVVVMRKKGTG
jgi:SAM-dependent methyltransferase